jgi:hypothetical protein
MSRVELPCPGCGAKTAFESSISLLAVCEYCRSLMMRSDLNVQDLGKVAELVRDGSPVQLGTRGVYGGRAFAVLGRLQLRYAQGLWNEWFLNFEDATGGWLGEAQGLYAVSYWVKPERPVPARGSLTLGQGLELGGTKYVVRDLRSARYESAQGQLPFQAPLGAEFQYADLAGQGTEFATIDYSEAEPLVFAGHYAKFDELHFENLRAFEGW